MAGSYAPNGNRYIPQLTTQGTTDYAQIVVNETATDAWMQAVEVWEAATDVWMQARAMYGDTGYTTLAEALTTIGATQATLVIPSSAGAVAVAVNTAVPSNVRLVVQEGAYFSVGNGVTLTIDGLLDAGPYQIFSCTGTGSVVFGDRVATVYPDWWATNTSPGTTNMAAAIQAATDSIDRGVVQFLPAEYGIGTTINGKSFISYKGWYDTVTWDNGTKLSLIASGPMFSFVPADGNGAAGWSFYNIYFDYNGETGELIAAYQSAESPYLGSYQARIDKCLFRCGGTGIYAENSWDWWITDNHFINSVETGACMWFFNGDKTTDDFCNWMHITGNFIETPFGTGILSDSTGMGVPNGFFMISGNHFESNQWMPGAVGYPSIAGTLMACTITGNGFGHTGLLQACIELGSVWSGGPGQNNVVNSNVFWDLGYYAIRSDDSYDVIQGNTFLYGTRGSAGAFIWLDANSSKCRVIGNNGDNTADPMVDDDGADNTILFNSGSDGEVNINDKWPVKIGGVQHYIQLTEVP